MKIEQGDNSYYIGQVEEPMAKVSYHIENKILYIDHVFVMPQLRGQGIAANLVETVLDFARENELKIEPICSYARSYLMSNEINNDNEPN